MKKAKRLLGLLVAGAMVLVIGGAALVASEEPAEAAFPGQNGLIAFTDERDSMIGAGVFIMRQDGTGERLIGLGNFVFSPEWSSDGKKIALGDINSDVDPHQRIYVVNADGGSGDRISVDERPDLWVQSPAWYPSGRRIAYCAAPFERDEEREERRITGDFEIFSVALDRTGRPSAPPVQLTDDDSNECPNSVSSDGQRLAFAEYGDADPRFAIFNKSETVEIHVMGANRREGPNNPAVPLTDNGTYDGDADFSPDGTKLAYDSYDAAADRYDVWVMDAADGSGKRNLTRNAKDPTNAGGAFPAWSPTGKKIAFWRYESGIYKMWADGSHEERLSTGVAPSWQPVP